MVPGDIEDGSQPGCRFSGPAIATYILPSDANRGGELALNTSPMAQKDSCFLAAIFNLVHALAGYEMKAEDGQEGFHPRGEAF